MDKPLYKNMTSIVDLMDERHWVRMAVCFAPGLIVAKISGYFPDSTLLSVFTAATLVVGIGLYLGWKKIRPQHEPNEAGDLDDEGQAVQGYAGATGSGDELQLLSHLRALCGEPERESDCLIATELALDPGLTFADAINRALARKRSN